MNAFFHWLRHYPWTTKDVVYLTLIALLFVATVGPSDSPFPTPTSEASGPQKTEPKKTTLASTFTQAFPQKDREDTTKYLSFVGLLLEHRPEDPTVRRFNSEVVFCPKFKNVTGKTITGIQFDAVFYDTFGEPQYQLDNLKITETLPPGKISSTTVHWKFEDNPFDPDEIYDILMPLITGNSIETKIQIKAIAYDNGQIQRFPLMEEASR